MSEQDEVLAFLASPASYDPPPPAVERIETHGAHVFLAGSKAVKIKRAVAFEYMDFSTLDLRRRAIEREYELNAPVARDLYLGAIPITRKSAGGLEFGGPGEVVEVSLHMRRFDQSGLLSEMAKAGPLPLDVTNGIADAIHAYHVQAVPRTGWDAVAATSRIIDELEHTLTQTAVAKATGSPLSLIEDARTHLNRNRTIIRDRAMSGHVRRCHGDLHLRNIVMLDGAPALFDALEFSEDLATIDTLYDVAFLLMDLDVMSLRAEANAIMGRYLWRRDCESDLSALGLLPLFLALRAGIRAMVAMQREAQLKQAGQPDAQAAAESAVEARRYLDRATAYLDPPAPALVAVGGFSGTGKTTLARILAPSYGACPGALHIRSDLERKAMFAVAETHRLPPESYTKEASAKVYARMFAKAERALGAGHAVVMDAVFSTEAERDAARQLAIECAVPFQGLWLEAARDTLIERVRTRTGDASDATPDVVGLQLAAGAGHIAWTSIDTGAGLEATTSAALRVLTAGGITTSR